MLLHYFVCYCVQFYNNCVQKVAASHCKLAHVLLCIVGL